MELKFQEVPLSYLHATETDAAYQEQTIEVIVPDSMPDVDRIVDCFGTVTVRSKDITANAITVTGGIQAGVLYIPEGESCPRKIEAFLPFTVKKDIDCADASVCYDGWLKSIDARLLNTRKVLIRANLGSTFGVYCPAQETLPQPLELPECLQLKRNSYAMVLPVCCGEKELTLNEELELPDGLPAIDSVLKTAYRVCIEESRMVGNKAVFKGEVQVHILYCSVEQKLCTWDGKVYFSQYAQLDCEPEEGEITACPMLTGVELDTDGQMDSSRLLLSLSMIMQLCVSAKLQVELAEDAYATRGAFEPEWKSCILQPRLDIQTIKQTGELSLPAEATEPVDAEVLLDCPSVRRDGENLWVTAPASMSVLYYDNEGRLQGRSGRGEISCSTILAREGKCRPRVISTQLPEVTVQTDTVLLRCAAEFCLDTYAQSNWITLSGGKLTEPAAKESRPSVVLRRTGKESLWNIAKSNHTTVDSIKAANDLNSDTPIEGSILLIPIK